MKLIIIASIVVASAITTTMVLANKKQVSREFHPIVPNISGQLEENTSQTATSSTESVATPTTTTTTSNSISANYSLNIPSIKLSAPIILNVDGNNQEAYLKALETGVSHMLRSAAPGDAGNTVLFGHSSYYKNKPGNYKTIFSTLNKIDIGSKILLKSVDKTLTYTVTSKNIVKPEDVSIVVQDKTKHILTLITCWPVGTTNTRYVVVATLDPS